MSTTWSITASDIIRGALELNTAIDPLEPISASDAELCLSALNGIIKEMPLHGLSWPQITETAVAVTWSGGTPGSVTPPTDYFGVPVLKYTNDTSKLVELKQIPKHAFDKLDLTQTAKYPECFYETPGRVFCLWPTPTVDPVLKLSYQAIAADASLTVAPDVQQAYLHLMQYWVADEVSMKCSTPAQDRQEIAARLNVKREMIKQWAVDKAPFFVEVDG